MTLPVPLTRPIDGSWISRFRWQSACRKVLPLLFGCVATASSASDDFELTRDGELLTLNANNASLVAIVDRLEELTEIKITFSEPFDTNITTEVEDADLESLISKLVSNSFIKKLDYQSHIKIAEVLLMPDGSESNVGAASLPSGEPAEAIIVDANGLQPTPSAGDDVQPTEAGQAEAPAVNATGADPVSNNTETGNQ